MIASDRAAALATARFLEASRNASWLSAALTVVAAAAIVFTNANPIALAIAIAAGVIEQVYTVRIAFDARLFDDLANDRIAIDDLDGALAGAFRLRNKGRPVTDRCRGAVKLVQISLVLTVVQAAALIAAGVLRS